MIVQWRNVLEVHDVVSKVTILQVIPSYKYICSYNLVGDIYRGCSAGGRAATAIL